MDGCWLGEEDEWHSEQAFYPFDLCPCENL